MSEELDMHIIDALQNARPRKRLSPEIHRLEKYVAQYAAKHKAQTLNTKDLAEQLTQAGLVVNEADLRMLLRRLPLQTEKNTPEASKGAIS